MKEKTGCQEEYEDKDANGDQEYKALCLRQKLNIAFHNHFSKDQSLQFQESLLIKSYTSSKVTLCFKEKIQLSSEDKDKIRIAIKKVYGDVDIVTTSGNIVKTTNNGSAQNIIRDETMLFGSKKDKMWQQVKKDVLADLGAYTERALPWLNYSKLQIKSLEDNKLVITTTPICADYIHELCNVKLDNAVKKNSISIEMIFGDHKNDKYYYH